MKKKVIAAVKTVMSANGEDWETRSEMVKVPKNAKHSEITDILHAKFGEEGWQSYYTKKNKIVIKLKKFIGLMWTVKFHYLKAWGVFFLLSLVAQSPNNWSKNLWITSIFAFVIITYAVLTRKWSKYYK